MAYEDHEWFDQLPDELRLWRYIDLPKLLSMLQTSTLWLSRSDLLGDPFEGTYNEGSGARKLALELAELAGPPGTYNPEEVARNIEHSRGRMREGVYLSCWHSSVYESAAMWRLYAGEAGVAVATTVGRLKKSMLDERTIFLGPIHYVDYGKVSFHPNQSLIPFLRKRLSFRHEEEVRVMYVDFDAVTGYQEMADGVAIPVDLSVLISQIRVSPDAPKWYLEVVQRTAQGLCPDVSVQQSDLVADPVL